MRNGFIESLAGCASWPDVHVKWAGFTEKEKGDRFEDLVQAFLQLSPLYRSQLKSVWRLEEVPQAVRNKLKLPATDKGIDLVAETHKGEFWAIQCKYRQNTDQQLTHTDISTFTSLTFQACKGFSFALVCSTTERVTQLYRGEERIGFCALDTWQELDAEFFGQLRAYLSNKPTALPPCKPRPHQENAVRDGMEYFSKGKAARGKLIMPCGTGKSLTAWFLAQALGSKRIVIAVPSLSLVKQTLKVWSRESAANDIAVDWICVCSDETAGRADQDDVVVHRQDIAVPCLTSTDKIAEWLKAKHKGLTVVFTTYQSGDVLATAARKAKFTFDLGIMDEAHKTVGDSDKQFSILLHDHNIEISQRVFMTATERRYKGSSDKVLSMDNVEIYGDTFHQLSFKQAMECHPPILCDYNVITIGVSRQEIKDLIKKNVFVRPTGGKWDEEMEADMLAAMVALRKAMKEHPIKHAVSFHGSIQRAELFKAHNDTFTREFPKFGGLDTFHVSGKTPTGTRSNIIKAFAQAERSLVTNARCLTEGVDVPGIDCVLFADPRKSTVDIVQAVGRALRPSEGKKLGYVILPVLHETDATSEQVIDSGAFKEILSTISALAANDDRIIEYFRGISQGRNPSGSSRVSFEWDERIAQNIDVAKLVNELEIKCWGRLAKLSWRPFEEARLFVHNLKLKSQAEWTAYSSGEMLNTKGRIPLDIPLTPRSAYKGKGWINMGDWLGTGTIAPNLIVYRPFDDAREFARSLKLKDGDEWRAFCAGNSHHSVKLPDDIPRHPDQTYADSGWAGMGDWIGNGFIAHSKRAFLSFNEARAFARSLALASETEWVAYCNGGISAKPPLPPGVPKAPWTKYKHAGWVSMGDWLGTGYVSPRKRKYWDYGTAQSFVMKLGLKSQKEWILYIQGKRPDLPAKPEELPGSPDKTYKGKGWSGVGHWLGTGAVADHLREYRSFDDALLFVRSLNLKSGRDWRRFCVTEKPTDIPAKPNVTYLGKGWVSMGHWLGTGTVAPRLRKHTLYPSFSEAREYARKLGLKTQKEWEAFCLGEISGLPPFPKNMSKSPRETYMGRGWKNMSDWLGTNKPSRNRVWRPFNDARQFARSLNLSTQKDWNKYCNGQMTGLTPRPSDIPRNPSQVYSEWAGLGDWLGANKVSLRDRAYMEFSAAREFVRGLKLADRSAWRRYMATMHGANTNSAASIPACPDQHYKLAGWISWGDWLGNGRAKRGSLTKD
jgi:superfamily II DNA or RNA helicase